MNRISNKKRKLICISKICQILLVLEELENVSNRRWWVRPINERRQNQGASDNLIIEMRLADEESFFNFTRMNIIKFDELLRIVDPLLLKQLSRKDVLPPKTRLLLTLRYLATGDSFASLHFLFRIGKSTVPVIIRETCDALHEKLRPSYLPPLTTDIVNQAAATFEDYCIYPNAWGAIDGKHIRIKAPNDSGTMFHNYKHFFSIVLLGVCDANLKFLYINIGGYGSESDGGIFRNSSLSQMLEQHNLQLPPPQIVGNYELPYVILGDAAFPLRRFLITPYPGLNLEPEKIRHNEILSKGRTKIENAFGVLAARWQIFLRSMSSMPCNADRITITCVLLHNYLVSANTSAYITDQLLDRFSTNGTRIDGQYHEIIGGRSILQPLPSRFRLGSRNPAREAIAIRNNIKDYLWNSM